MERSPTKRRRDRYTSSSITGFIPTSGGVAGSDCPSPLRSVLGVLWQHASCAEVFRDAVFPPPLWVASPSSSSLQCLDSPAYIAVFPSFHMARPAQPALSDLSHQFSHLHSFPDDSFFNAIKRRFSQGKPQHFHLCYLHLSLLALGHCHCFHTI